MLCFSEEVSKTEDGHKLTQTDQTQTDINCSAGGILDLDYEQEKALKVNAKLVVSELTRKNSIGLLDHAEGGALNHAAGVVEYADLFLEDDSILLDNDPDSGNTSESERSKMEGERHNNVTDSPKQGPRIVKPDVGGVDRWVERMFTDEDDTKVIRGKRKSVSKVSPKSIQAGPIKSTGIRAPGSGNVTVGSPSTFDKSKSPGTVGGHSLSETRPLPVERNFSKIGPEASMTPSRLTVRSRSNSSGSTGVSGKPDLLAFTTGVKSKVSPVPKTNRFVSPRPSPLNSPSSTKKCVPLMSLKTLSSSGKIDMQIIPEPQTTAPRPFAVSKPTSIGIGQRQTSPSTAQSTATSSSSGAGMTRKSTTVVPRSSTVQTPSSGGDLVDPSNTASVSFKGEDLKTRLSPAEQQPRPPIKQATFTKDSPTQTTIPNIALSVPAVIESFKLSSSCGIAVREHDARSEASASVNLNASTDTLKKTSNRREAMVEGCSVGSGLDLIGRYSSSDELSSASGSGVISNFMGPSDRSRSNRKSASTDVRKPASSNGDLNHQIYVMDDSGDSRDDQERGNTMPRTKQMSTVPSISKGKIPTPKKLSNSQPIISKYSVEVSSSGPKSSTAVVAAVKKKNVRSVIASLWKRDSDKKPSKSDKKDLGAEPQRELEAKKDGKKKTEEKQSTESGLGKSPKSYRKSFPLVRSSKKRDATLLEFNSKDTSSKEGLTRSNTYDKIDLDVNGLSDIRCSEQGMHEAESSMMETSRLKIGGATSSYSVNRIDRGTERDISKGGGEGRRSGSMVTGSQSVNRICDLQVSNIVF